MKRKYCFWTDDEIEIVQKKWKTMTTLELMKLIPRHDRSSILKKMKSLGIYLSKSDISWRAKYANSFINPDNICKMDQNLSLYDLDNTILQVLLGSMLGDGCSTKQSSNLRNFRFYEGHALNQSDYVTWKAKILDLFQPRLAISKKAEFVTLTHPIFTFLRDKFYATHNRCQKSIVPLDLLEKLDLFGIMIWYLDDGNFGKKSWSVSVGVKGWNHSQICELIQRINDKFSLSLYVYTSGHGEGYNRVVKIPIKDKWLIEKWKDMAVEYNIPQKMFYKFGT